MPEVQHIVCTSCGGVNRLPTDRDFKAARCGVCSRQLFNGHPQDVDTATLEKQIARSTIPVLVDVWAPWCGPCRMMAPAFEAAARQLEPNVRLVKLNSDAEPATAGRFGIRGIPTMLLFKGGSEIARTSGALTAGQIVGWVRNSLGLASLAS